MDFKVMKRVVDEAGNIGYQLEAVFSGSVADVQAHLQALTDCDGIDRQAELAVTGGAYIVGVS